MSPLSPDLLSCWPGGALGRAGAISPKPWGGWAGCTGQCAVCSWQRVGGVDTSTSSGLGAPCSSLASLPLFLGLGITSKGEDTGSLGAPPDMFRKGNKKTQTHDLWVGVGLYEFSRFPRIICVKIKCKLSVVPEFGRLKQKDQCEFTTRLD